jgi:hypothetical protein
MEEYLRAVDPIAEERMRLREGSLQITMDQHGNVVTRLPPRLQAIDDEYVHMIERLQTLHFGAANVSHQARRDSGVALDAVVGNRKGDGHANYR